jgi:hypothetical protein
LKEINLFLNYPSLLCLIIIAFYPQYADDAAVMLAGLLTIFATLFYLLILSTIIGIREIGLTDDIDINYTWQSRTIQVASLVVLMMSGLTDVAYYILPFALIGLAADVFSTLLSIGVIEEADADQEDDQ